MVLVKNSRKEISMAKEYAVDPSNPVETIELLRALFELYSIQGDIRADKKFGVDDLLRVVKGAPSLYLGFVGFQYVDEELVAKNKEGDQKIKEAIAEFDLDDEAVEELSEEGIELLIHMAEYGSKVSDYLKNRKRE